MTTIFYGFTSQTIVVIFLQRCMIENNNNPIPTTPNSIPLKGSTLKNPPIPKIPAKPNAQEEHAGVNMLVMIPDKPIPAL